MSCELLEREPAAEENKTLEKQRKGTSDEILKMITTRGLSGSSNLGNTCYMNATLQLLSGTAPLLSYIISKNSPIKKDIEQSILDSLFIENEKKNESAQEKEDFMISQEDIMMKVKQTLTYQLRTVLKYMWAHNCEVEPKKFKRAVNKQLPFFDGMRQHDAQEFLTALLDKIHENTKLQAKIVTSYDQQKEQLEEKIIQLDKKLEDARNTKDKVSMKSVIDELEKIYKFDRDAYFHVKMIITWKNILASSLHSIINDIFSGTFLITTECDVCKKEYHKFERFDIFMLHLPEEIDVDKQSYTLSELMQNYVTPERMIDKNRCMCEYCYEKTESVRRHMIYQQPNTLIIMIKKYQKYQNRIIKSNIKIIYDHELDISPYMYTGSKGCKKYELYSVIRHSGGCGGGHYYAYTKNPLNDLWYLFNDGNVYGVEPEEAINSNGYVLAYKIK